MTVNKVMHTVRLATSPLATVIRPPSTTNDQLQTTSVTNVHTTCTYFSRSCVKNFCNDKNLPTRQTTSWQVFYHCMVYMISDARLCMDHHIKVFLTVELWLKYSNHLGGALHKKLSIGSIPGYQKEMMSARNTVNIYIYHILNLSKKM